MPAYRPQIKLLLYGESGSWKSSFAKTLPKPLLAWMFDPAGKDMPYMKDYTNRFLPSESVGDLQQWQIAENMIVPYRDIQQADGPIRIEYYHEHDDLRCPTAAKTFRTRLSTFHREYSQWKTVVVDSLTALEFVCRKDAEYNLLTGDKYDQRHWYGVSSHDLEELVAHRFPSMPLNVVVISHLHLKETGEMGGELVRLLSLPGQLKKTAPRSYMEYYYAYVGLDPSDPKRETGLLQTKTGGRYYAASQIDAPNPCIPHYNNLFKNFDNE